MSLIKDKGKLAEPTVSLSTEERRELKENRARAALAKELQSVESSRVPPGAPGGTRDDSTDWSSFANAARALFSLSSRRSSVLRLTVGSASLPLSLIKDI